MQHPCPFPESEFTADRLSAPTADEVRRQCIARLGYDPEDEGEPVYLPDWFLILVGGIWAVIVSIGVAAILDFTVHVFWGPR